MLNIYVYCIYTFFFISILQRVVFSQGHALYRRVRNMLIKSKMQAFVSISCFPDENASKSKCQSRKFINNAFYKKITELGIQIVNYCT